jgi:pimeloyl-ACP methyl ester carboxylesterase
MPKPQFQPPVIVVPGITGTGLQDYYPIPPEEVWSAVLKKNYERISMHPDNPRYEALEPARVQPYGIFGIIYEDLVEALRHDLMTRRTEPTPVYPFSYDWRQDCTQSADLLAGFIEEVIERTVLLPHYREAKKALCVDLVAHSMGGLIVADYLARYGKDQKVRRVVSIASPFEGSVDAIEKVSTGMGTLTGSYPRDREREASRTIPAIYQLLPSYDGAVADEPGQPNDIFDVQTWRVWQRSVLMTLREYIRLHKAEIDPETLLGQYLDTAWKHRQRIRKLDLARALRDGVKGWMAIAGLGELTQIKVETKRDVGGRWFSFPPPVEEWKNDHASMNTGDGTVPFAGAIPRFLKSENLVCVSRAEFGIFELGDRALALGAGLHAALPTVNLVQRLTIKFLRREYSGDIEARPAPGVTRPEWPMDISVK